MDVQGERMRQGTTPTIQITVNNIDLADMEHIYVVFEQNGLFIEKRNDRFKNRKQCYFNFFNTGRNAKL